jgi:hypothetical protein
MEKCSCRLQCKRDTYNDPMTSPRPGFYKPWSDDQANDFVNKLLEVLSSDTAVNYQYSIHLEHDELDKFDIESLWEKLSG